MISFDAYFDEMLKISRVDKMRRLEQLIAKTPSQKVDQLASLQQRAEALKFGRLARKDPSRRAANIGFGKARRQYAEQYGSFPYGKTQSLRGAAAKKQRQADLMNQKRLQISLPAGWEAKWRDKRGYAGEYPRPSITRRVA